MEDEQLDDQDYSIMVHMPFAKYLLLDVPKFMSNYEMLYEILKMECPKDEDVEMRTYVCILQACFLEVYFDAMFVHNLKTILDPDVALQGTREEEIKVFYEDYLLILSKFLFSQEAKHVEISVHGFCKLLIHQRLEEPANFVSVLLLLWHQKKNTAISGYTTQVLSLFFNAFTSSRITDVEVFEDGFEYLYL